MFMRALSYLGKICMPVRTGRAESGVWLAECLEQNGSWGYEVRQEARGF